MPGRYGILFLQSGTHRAEQGDHWRKPGQIEHSNHHVPPMKQTLLILSISILGLTGCSHSKPDVTYMNPAPVAGSTVASNSVESVHTQDVIKAYPNGRYVDPHDGNVMYGQGVAYQVQQSGNWNLNNNDPVHVPLGPVTEYTTPAGNPNVTSPEIEQKLREEDSVVKIVTS